MKRVTEYMEYKYFKKNIQRPSAVKKKKKSISKADKYKYTDSKQCAMLYRFTQYRVLYQVHGVLTF